YSTTNGFNVSYSASDASPSSGFKKVELYVKRPGDSVFNLTATDTPGGTSGSFCYTAAAGDGNYSFYTLAYDNAGNVESAPASAATTTFVDTAKPSLTVSHSADGSNGWNVSSPVSVSVSASDAGSGLDAGSPSCKEGTTALTLTPAGSGSWTLSVSGQGTHLIDCQATDKATNQTLKSDTVKIDTVA